MMKNTKETAQETRTERYEMTWPDKSKAAALAEAPTDKLLRPVRERSVDFDRTGNLFIEGDNLEALKLLRGSMRGTVDMIYIDPPYNTGNDFLYRDDYSVTAAEYAAKSTRLTRNSEHDGRFHADWLNMMYPRLKVARDLLSESGIIFISIDTGEHANLRKLCDEIFGASNFLIDICVNKPSEIATKFTVNKHEYALVYVKNLSLFRLRTMEKYTFSRGTVGNRDQTMPIITFPAGLPCRNVKDGVYEHTRTVRDSLENVENFDPIVVEDGKLKYPVRLRARWRSSNDMRRFFENGCRPTPAKINGEVVEISFESDRFNPHITKRTFEKIPSFYLKNKRGSDDLKALGLEKLFPFPKAVSLISFFVRFAPKDALVLDFFAGSATTAQAVMELNAADGGTRRFILVELPEACNAQSEAYLAGYGTICELGEERVRRAGSSVAARCPDCDVGFRVLRIASPEASEPM